MDKTAELLASVWVLADQPDRGCFERLGDAVRLARSIGSRVGVALVPRHFRDSNQFYSFDDSATSSQFSEGINHDQAPHSLGWRAVGGEGDMDQQYSNHLPSNFCSHELNKLITYGTDLVRTIQFVSPSPPLPQRERGESSVLISQIDRLRATHRLLSDHPVRVLFVGGEGPARELGSLLAAEQDWEWISPTLMIRFQSNQFQITRLDSTGRRSCKLLRSGRDTLVISIKDGVAEPFFADSLRRGLIEQLELSVEQPLIDSKRIPLDPTVADIRDCKRLVSGGRGLGSAAGFELLQRVAKRLDAGIAASRMAVDAGWIEQDRQVGQTGKTVEPELYIACGISGASHHLDGMSTAKHLVAINTDSNAAIMKHAHLKLAADLYEVLEATDAQLLSRQQRAVEDVQNVNAAGEGTS